MISTRRFRPQLGSITLLLLATTTASAQTPSESTGAGTTEASAEAIAQARTHFQRAEKLYNERAFEAALVELLKAYELAPSYRILYNIGLAHLEVGDYASATLALRRYLAEGGDEVPRARRKEVTEKVASLRDRVATLKIEINEPNAEVFIDDVPVGHSPLVDPVLVNAGRRKVVATLPSRPQLRAVVVVAGGDTTSIELTFPARQRAAAGTTTAPSPSASATHAPSPKPPPAIPPTESDHTWVWVGWTATGLLAAGTITTGILANSASSDLQAERNSYTADPAAKRDALDSAANRAQTLALVTDVLGGAALLVGGISLYATFSGGDTKSGVEVGAAPNGVKMSGRF